MKCDEPSSLALNTTDYLVHFHLNCHLVIVNVGHIQTPIGRFYRDRHTVNVSHTLSSHSKATLMPEREQVTVKRVKSCWIMVAIETVNLDNIPCIICSAVAKRHLFEIEWLISKLLGHSCRVDVKSYLIPEWIFWQLTHRLEMWMELVDNSQWNLQ